MSDSDLFDRVVGHLVATAKAHHEATGGVNSQWAKWYAEHLVGALSETLDGELNVGQLEAWLTEADRRYRNETQTRSWPKAYAGWLITEFHPDVPSHADPRDD